MKTGRLELYIETDEGYLRPAFNEDGNQIKCETYKRMDELTEQYRFLLKKGECFVVEENW